MTSVSTSTKEKLKNFLSTKFFAAIGGVGSGIYILTQGQTIVGASTILISIITYCVANSYITAKTAGTIMSDVSTIATAVGAITGNETVKEVAEVASGVNSGLAVSTIATGTN